MTNTPSESKIQQNCVQWYRNTYCLTHHNPRCMIFSVPNESSGPRAMRLIQTGLYPGCADLVICHVKPSGKSRYEEFVWLFIEVKTPFGIQSDNQKSFEAHAKSMGIGYHVVRSLDEFKAIAGGL